MFQKRWQRSRYCGSCMQAQQQLIHGKNFKFQQGTLWTKKQYGIAEEGRSSIWYQTLILLPRSHPLTTLIVRGVHVRVCHKRVKETLNETRRKFWIPRGRSLTKYIVHHCVLCRQFEEDPFKTPPPQAAAGALNVRIMVSQKISMNHASQ